MTQSDRSDFSRRNFLQALGAFAGAAVAAPANSSESVLSFLEPAFHGPLRVGVAMPGFDARGRQRQAWLDGLRLALGDKACIEIETAGAYAPQVRQACQSLLQRKVHVVVGAITPAHARDLGRVLGGSEALFLNVEPGGHIARVRDRHPQVLHHTLNLWQANYASGVWAAQNLGKRAAIVASFRESGYDTLAAFQLGMESAGGKVVDTQVSKVPGQERDAATCLQAAHCQKPDFVYAAGIAGVTDALSSPLGRNYGAAETGFAERYTRYSGHTPDAYALLGFEAGGLLIEAAQQAREHRRPLRSCLASASINGPRGQVSMNPATHTSTAQNYVDASGAALPKLQPVHELSVISHSAWRLAVSGWAVPYAA